MSTAYFGIHASEVKAYTTSTPAVLDQERRTALKNLGISVRTGVSVVPVGLSPRPGNLPAWLTTEPVLISAIADIDVARLAVSLDGAEPQIIPCSQSRAYIAIEHLEPGRHSLALAPMLFNETRRRSESPPRERLRSGYEDLHDIILFLANTGLRPDELLRLEVRDISAGIDDETGQRILTIEVRGKVGFGPCKSMPGAVEPVRRLIARRARELGIDPDKASLKALVEKMPPSTRLIRKLPRARLNSVLAKLDLKEDREGHPRTFYSLRHTYICMRLLDGAHAYELAKNCRTSVEMIEKHYAVHLKNYIDASLINVRKKKRRHRQELDD